MPALNFELPRRPVTSVTLRRSQSGAEVPKVQNQGMCPTLSMPTYVPFATSLNNRRLEDLGALQTPAPLLFALACSHFAEASLDVWGACRPCGRLLPQGPRSHQVRSCASAKAGLLTRVTSLKGMECPPAQCRHIGHMEGDQERTSGHLAHAQHEPAFNKEQCC